MSDTATDPSELSPTIDTEQLDAALAGALARQGWTDDAETQPPADHEPDPTALTDAAPGQTQKTQDATGTTAQAPEGEGDGGAASTTSPSTPGAPASEPADPTFDVNGRKLTAAQIEGLINFGNYFANVTPEVGEIIDAAVQGRITPERFRQLMADATSQQPGQSGAPASSLSPSSTSSPAAPSTAATTAGDEWIDPAAEAAFRAQQQAIAEQQRVIDQLRAEAEQRRASESQTEQQRHVVAQDTELDTLIGARGLAPEDRDRIVDAARTLPNLRAIADKHGANINAMYREVFEEALWHDPALRSKLLQAQIDDALIRERNKDAKGNASAVAPGGTRTPPPATKLPEGAGLNELRQVLAKDLEKLPMFREN